MRTVAGVAPMQRMALAWRKAGAEVAFVPTMGCLHAGHISLVSTARKLVGKNGIVVLSIYVNPTQFGPKEDFAKYPRTLKSDSKLCRDAGVDVLFVPSDTEMYPRDASKSYSTFVVEEELSKRMEGASRPSHFRGVTTIVAKLFNLVLPTVSVFGAKDFQQAQVIRRMVRDLNFPIKILVAPTLREPDGLAMSSRNRYLTPEQRSEATILSEAIVRARSWVATQKRPMNARDLEARVKVFIRMQTSARVDYVSFFDPETLEPRETVSRGTQMALAVFVGSTRLIDNGSL